MTGLGGTGTPGSGRGRLRLVDIAQMAASEVAGQDVADEPPAAAAAVTADAATAADNAVAPHDPPTPAGQRVGSSPLSDQSKVEILNHALAASEVEARELRQRLEDFIFAACDWVWETDEGARIVFVSERISEITGRPATFLRGQNLFDIGRCPDDGPGMSLLDSLNTRTPFRNCLFEIRDTSGNVCRFSLCGQPSFDRDTGHFTGFRGTGTDISGATEVADRTRGYRQKLEHEVEEIRNRNVGLELDLSDARTASRARSDFLANISHELRTPLNAIIGFAAVMEDEMFGPLGGDRYREYVRDIHASGSRLLTVIGDMLDMSNIEAGKIELRESEVDIDVVAGSCRRLLLDRAREQGVSLELVSSAGPRTIRADERMLRQAILNLLSNSIAFTRQGGQVRVETGREADGRVRISVIDNGIGIGKEDLDKVLEPFGQVEGPYARTHQGAGLGLPIARSLIEMHGGGFEMQSQPGEGTRIDLFFPADRIVTEQAD